MVHVRPALPALSAGALFSGPLRPPGGPVKADPALPADRVHFSGHGRPAPITLGSDPYATHRVSAAHVLPRHAEIRTAEDGTWLHAHGDTRVDDRLLHRGEHYRVEPGDVITLGEYADDPSFLLTGEQAVPIRPETAMMVRSLFPKGARDIEIRQGGVKACTVLATMAATAFNDPLSLISAITPLYDSGDELTGYEVRFPGGPRTVVDLDDLNAGETGTRGALAANLYEIAYAQAFLGRQPGESVIEKYQDGLYEDIVLNHMTGREVTGILMPKGEAPYTGRYDKQDLGGHPLSARELDRAFETALRKIAAQPKEHIAIAGTKPWDGGSIRYGIANLHQRHLYAVVGADPASRMIRLADPHRSGERFWMPWDDFKRHFLSLIYVS